MAGNSDITEGILEELSVEISELIPREISGLIRGAMMWDFPEKQLENFFNEFFRIPRWIPEIIHERIRWGIPEPIFGTHPLGILGAIPG